MFLPRSKRIFWYSLPTLVLLLALLASSKAVVEWYRLALLAEYKWKSPRDQYCGRSDIRQGEWMREDDTEPYRWSVVDNNCQYNEVFQPDSFCSLMENQVILFLGDSLSRESWLSLKILTNGQSGPQRNKFSKAQALSCSNTVEINFWMSNRLNDLQHEIDDWSEGPIELHNSSLAHFPTAIVMNTGAWYQSDDVYSSVMVEALEYVRVWQELCRADTGSVCPFVWRTTPPGMPGCMEYHQPMNNITLAEELLVAGTSANDEEAMHFKYHWSSFREQNLIAEELLERSGLDYVIIDGYEIGITRPDNHKSETDCLHHPEENLEVPHAWNTVLLHYLGLWGETQKGRPRRGVARVSERD